MAPVRNLRGLGNTKPIPVFAWIPPVFSPIFKIEVVTDAETFDVTDLVVDGKYTDGITTTIGSFEFRIDNSTQQFTDKFSVYDPVKIYMDYGSTATTLKYVGLIERPSTAEENVLISGRGSAIRAIGKNVTYKAVNKSRSEILSDIIDKYFSGVITKNNLETDTGTMTVNYFDRPFWEVVEEVCSDGSHDAYIDPSFDFNYFETGSRLNQTEAVVHESNLIETGDFSEDLEDVSNRVKVYGITDGNVPLIATADSEEAQALVDGDIKELKINDSNITTEAQAQARADFELAVNKDPPTVGTVLSLGLPTISPGEQIKISDPLNSLSPGFYQVHNFTHIFSNDDPLKTELTIRKERTSIPTILKQRARFETEVTDNINPNEMDTTLVLDYNLNSGLLRFADGSFTDTELEVNNSTGIGVLKTTSGNSTGSWLSENITIDAPITTIEIRVNGTDLAGTKYFVSLDGGLNFVEIGSSAGDFSFQNAQNSIQLRVDLKSGNSRLEKIGLLYKTT